LTTAATGWCSTIQPPPDTPLSPAGTTVPPSASVRNLGVLFDPDLSLILDKPQRVLWDRRYMCT